jgi:hypothetical protein
MFQKSIKSCEWPSTMQEVLKSKLGSLSFCVMKFLFDVLLDDCFPRYGTYLCRIVDIYKELNTSMQ